MKRNASYLSKRLLLPLSVWLWCAGNTLSAQQTEEKPAPGMTCIVENGTSSEADTYAVSNVDDIRLTVNLSNPQGLNLRLPSLWEGNKAEPGGRNVEPTLSVVTKKLSGSNREDVETKVGGRGISRRANDTRVFLGLEIPITASERMKGISEYVKTLFTKPEEAESRKLGRELTVAALLLSRYPQNQVGFFEVVVTYWSYGPEYWEGRVSCPPIHLEVRDDGTFFDKAARDKAARDKAAGQDTAR